MTGQIKSYVAEKGYGFIQGDDGKSYFFHVKQLKNMSQAARLCEGAHTDFEPEPTPKGYKAKKLVVLNSSEIDMYIIPEGMQISREETIKGWEIIERGDWLVLGSSRETPDAAKNDLVDSAHRTGANGVIQMWYFKTTGSEAGTGRGTHHYTIHNFKGRIVTLAKKHVNGEYRVDDLMGLNKKAMQTKEELQSKTAANKKRRNIIWGSIICASALSWLISSGVGVGSTIVLVICGAIWGRSTDYDWWLHQC